jgi:hypothetical protein
MSKGHFVSGVVSGLLVAPLVPTPDLEGAARHLGIYAVYAILVALCALMPDIDHKPAVASKMIPLLSPAICWFYRWLSEVIYQATRTEKDRPTGCHRTFTHTTAFALIHGGGLYAALQFTPYAAWGIFLGSSVTVGCLTHVWFIGDACTLSGVPHPAWPLVKRQGKRWFTVGYPSVLRFRAGGLPGTIVKGEVIATWILTAAAGVLAVVTVAAAGGPWWTGVSNGLDAFAQLAGK